MSIFKIVEVPEEEPERLMEPWEIYMTDPVVAQAVNALAIKDGVTLPVAAAHLAKTVVPAPQYVAAHDARYLLAPETAEADEALMRSDEGLMGWVVEGVEVNPDNPAGWPYTEPHGRAEVRAHVLDRIFGLQSTRDELREVQGEDDVRVTDENPHTGVEVREGPPSPGMEYDGGSIVVVDTAGQLFGMDSGPQASDVGTFFHQLMEMMRTQSARDWQVPPLVSEGLPQTISVTFLQGGVPTEEARQELWHQRFRAMEEHLSALDLIPLSPPLVHVEGEHVRVRVDAVPAQERTFILGVSFDMDAAHLRELAESRPNCRLLHATDYEGFATAVSWDRHVHMTARAFMAIAQPQETEGGEGSG